MKVVVWLFALVVIVGFVAPVMGAGNHGVGSALGAPASVRINGDAELKALAKSENWSGNGTSADPYIISNYSIDGHGSGVAFYVGNTTLYFVLENSHFYNATDGIYLYNVQNAIIKDNNCSYNTRSGIYVSNSHDNTFYGNVMYGNGLYLTGDKLTFTSQYIPANNSVNGKPVEYYAEDTNVNVNSNAGEVIIAESDTVTISSLDISNSTVGVVIAYSTDIKLEDSHITNMYLNGVYVMQSSNVTLYNNEIARNGKNGVYFSHVTGSFLNRNNCSYNVYSGVYLSYSSGNTLNGDKYFNNSGGLHLFGSYNNVIENEVIGATSGDGLLLDNSNDNFIMHSSVSYSSYGVHIKYSTNNTFYGNTLVHNGFYIEGDNAFLYQDIETNNTVNGGSVIYYAAQDLYGAKLNAGAGQIILAKVSNAVIENQHISNVSVGVELWHSTDIVIANSVFSFTSTSIDVSSSKEISISGNYFSDSDSPIVMNYGSFSVIDNNTFYNVSSGLKMMWSDFNVVNNNTFMDNGVAYYLNGSWNVIQRNTLSHSGAFGLLMVGASHNIIRSNNFTHTGFYAVLIQAGSYNVIYNNTFEFNNGTGSTYTSSHIQAGDMDVGNLWNTSYGNYWYDWANNNNTNDKNNDGIVDYPYYVDPIGGGGVDYKPLKNASSAKVFVPSSPVHLFATAGSGYVLLHWMAPIDDGGSSITQYIIYRNGVPIKTVSAAQQSYNDTNVNDGQSYVYTVRAVNSVGLGFKSAEVEATPGGEVPEFSSAIVLGVVFFALMVIAHRRR